MARDLLQTVFSPVKLFAHDRMEGWKKGENTYPITMELGPSGPGNCPHECNFCMHGSYYDLHATMNFAFYKKIIDELSSFEPNKRTRGMIFSASGEPTYNPKINDFIRYTKERGVNVAMSTNGWGWINRTDLIDTVLRYMDWTRTSLNAGTAETRKKIHGVEDFEEVLEALTELARKKKETKSKCHIGGQIVVSEDNFGEIYIAAGKVKKTGLDYIQIKPVVFHPKDGKDQLSKNFWEDVLISANIAQKRFEDKDFKVFIKNDQFEAIMKPDHDKSAYEKCRATFFPVIEADGTVFHCSQTRGLPEFELGNLHEQSFEEIWEGEKRKEILKSINIDECQPVCRCHYNNRVLRTIDLKENAPSFV